MDGRAGATLSLNVLSFQTSFETWTTAAIINWKKLLRLSVVSKLEEISSLRPALPSGQYLSAIFFFLVGHKGLANERKGRKKLWPEERRLAGGRRRKQTMAKLIHQQIYEAWPSNVCFLPSSQDSSASGKGKDIRLAHQILVPHGLSPRFMPANVIFLSVRWLKLSFSSSSFFWMSFSFSFQKEERKNRSSKRTKENYSPAT